MGIERFENRFTDEIWVVADGLSCPKIPLGDYPILAVNYGYRNVTGKPYGLVYSDAYFRNHHDGIPMGTAARYIFRSLQSGDPLIPNDIPFRSKSILTPRLRDGVYSGKHPSGRSSGVAALSIALGMTTGTVRIFGFDNRIFTDQESEEFFGKKASIHASSANHRKVKVDDATIRAYSRVYSNKINSFDEFRKESHRIVNHSMHSNLHQFVKQEIDLTGPC